MELNRALLNLFFDCGCEPLLCKLGVFKDHGQLSGERHASDAKLGLALRDAFPDASNNRAARGIVRHRQTSRNGTAVDLLPRDRRHHNVDWLVHRQSIKAAGHHAHDHKWNRIHRNALPDYSGIISKAAFPVAITDHCCPTATATISCGSVVSRNECTAKLGLHLQDAKVVAGNEVPRRQFGMAPDRDTQPLFSHFAGNAFNLGSALLYLLEVAIQNCAGNLEISDFNAIRADKHQLLRILHRQRIQQNGIDQTEDRGIRTNAER